MKKQFYSAYSLKYPQIIIYMLQRVEYEVKPFLKWFFRVENFNKISIRGALIITRKSKLLLGLLNSLVIINILLSLYFLSRGYQDGNIFFLILGAATLILYPLITVLAMVLPLICVREFIVKPQQAAMIKKSKEIFKSTTALKIAVAGSYGKTTMKELLTTVLSESGLVAATPGNMNVAASHAVFASKLTGQEKYIIVEFGEGEPGDVVRFTETIEPNIGVITGIAPAHLDKYPNLDTAAKDIFSLAKILNNQNIYVNGESENIDKYINSKDLVYSSKGIDGWRVTSVVNSFEGISFNLTKAREIIHVKSKLMGRHQIGPLSAVAVLAKNTGASIDQIEKGIGKTKSFEHRMELKYISGAYVIDDTYNGNLEGIRAGLSLMSELDAKRKIYVTPGLVDQGKNTTEIHNQIGRMIKDVKPDRVVLIKNSVTNFILDGLGDFKNEVMIEDNPLRFYTNLDKILASGDLLLMQNDWPDNYN
jgi:UDP-N-acetylmuramoyl-tripeptide--D-alanyl-D-alanine ligase